MVLLAQCKNRKIAKKSFLDITSAMLNENIQWVLPIHSQCWQPYKSHVKNDGYECLHRVTIHWIPVYAARIGRIVALELLCVTIYLSSYIDNATSRRWSTKNG